MQLTDLFPAKSPSMMRQRYQCDMPSITGLIFDRKSDVKLCALR